MGASFLPPISYIAGMKKVLAIMLLATACSDDEPVFKIEEQFLVSRFDKFVEVASNFDVTIPKNNLILRFSSDDNTSVNDSRGFKDGDQLIIEVDNKFVETNAIYENRVEFILFQLLAHNIVGTPYRDCGLMKQVTAPSDIPADPQMDYGTYPNLFDSESSCLE